MGASRAELCLPEAVVMIVGSWELRMRFVLADGRAGFDGYL